MAMVLHIDSICFKEYFKEYERLRFEGVLTNSSENNEKYINIRYLLALLLDELKKDSVENKITLDKLANMLGYNSSYIWHFFKVNIGINFHDFLTRVRIREATLELAKTNHSISDIALAHGFSNVKSFNKSFKESFGRLPNQYRTEIKDNNPSKQFVTKRIFVHDNNKDVNYKLKEYRNMLKNNPFFMDEMSLKEQELFKEEFNLAKYQNKITELERHIEELNKKMELIRGLLHN